METFSALLAIGVGNSPVTHTDIYMYIIWIYKYKEWNMAPANSTYLWDISLVHDVNHVILGVSSLVAKDDLPPDLDITLGKL